MAADQARMTNAIALLERRVANAAAFSKNGKPIGHLHPLTPLLVLNVVVLNGPDAGSVPSAFPATYGDFLSLSVADVDILALAYDIQNPPVTLFARKLLHHGAYFGSIHSDQN